MLNISIHGNARMWATFYFSLSKTTPTSDGTYNLYWLEDSSASNLFIYNPTTKKIRLTGGAYLVTIYGFE